MSLLLCLAAIVLGEISQRRLVGLSHVSYRDTDDGSARAGIFEAIVTDGQCCVRHSVVAYRVRPPTPVVGAQGWQALWDTGQSQRATGRFGLEWYDGSSNQFDGVVTHRQVL